MKSEFLKFLEKSIKSLSETGAENPEADSEIIFSEATGIPRVELRICGRITLSDAEKNKIEEILTRRLSGEPLQYIFGKAYFRSMRLDIGPGALIPRPETEILVDEALKCMPPNAKVCDIGVGSGAVALSMAYERPDCEAWGIDISADALKWARSNLQKYALKNVRLLQGNLLEPAKQEKFNLITANLPYVSSNEYDRLPSEIRDFEPKNALLAEDGGLFLVKKLIRQASRHLFQKGSLIIEFDPGQVEELEDFFKTDGSCFEIKLIKDLCGKTRFIKATEIY
jgi:release factor glutamine methyltransferase